MKSTAWLTYLVKTLLSRNFCQKSVNVNFRNFNTTLVNYVSQMKLILRATKYLNFIFTKKSSDRGISL